MAKPDYLFVALPSGDLPFSFPVGMVDLINRLDRPVAAHFVDDLPDSVVRSVRAAVMPVHWFYSLGPAIDLAARLKALNPEIRIVTGGLTAQQFAKPLVDGSEIDFVIRGDAEKPFVDLMTRLLDGGDPTEVPNLVWRGGETPVTYCADEAVLAGGRFRDISWFPRYEAAALATQRLDDPAFLYPWAPAMRWSWYDWRETYDSYAARPEIENRPRKIVRPPESLRADLEHWSARPEVRWCYFNVDVFATLGADWARAALDGRFDLTAYLEWYKAPDRKDVDLVLSRFSRAIFAYYLRPRACGDEDDSESARLCELLRSVGTRARTLVYLSPEAAAADRTYLGAARAAAKAGCVEIKAVGALLDTSSPTPSAEEIVNRFRLLVSESRAAMPRFARQHKLIAFAFLKSALLYRVLWRVSCVLPLLKTAYFHVRGRLRRGR